MAATDSAGAKETDGITSSTGGQPASLRTSPGSNIQVSPHRLSFTEHLRNGPASPRQRNPSLNQAAVQELMNNPPTNKHANPKFVGRDWQDVSVGELVSHDDVRWASFHTSVEEATSTLLKSPTSVVLVRKSEADSTAVSVFDFSDLNAYLLTVVGLATPDSQHIAACKSVMDKAQSGGKVLLSEIQPLSNSGPLITLDSECKLGQAVEILGGGIHRLLVIGNSGEAIGVMSQLRVLDFFWNEGVNFANIDSLYPMALRELATGTQHPISINSDEPLRKALGIMNEEGLSSIAVVDNGRNVVGNISVKDVRHLTTTSSAPLLNDSCMHFISVILNERGVERGRDAFPVFYVNPLSTLAHTVAKLVATRSHRMWVVESVSPASSIPPTPSFGPSGSAASVHDLSTSVTGGSVPASALAGARLSGKLTGVVSLTDILNIFARSTGLRPSDPGEQRARRRRSSSSSMRPLDVHGRSIR